MLEYHYLLHLTKLPHSQFSLILYISIKSRLYLYYIYIIDLGRPYFGFYPTPSHGIVVEPSPIRSSAADYPILIIFQHSRLGLFHPYVVVYKTLGLSSNSRSDNHSIFLLRTTISKVLNFVQSAIAFAPRSKF